MADEKETYRALCSHETVCSRSKGFFRDFSDTIAAVAGSSWLEKVFGKLCSDEERVLCLFTDPKISQSVLETLGRINYLYRDKDAQISKAKRLEGCQFISRSDYERALLCFSQAVLRAPSKGVLGKISPTSDNLSLNLALLGRADALMALGDYEFALDDLKAAFDEDLPTPARKQWQEKMRECEKHLASMSLESSVSLMERKTEVMKNRYREFGIIDICLLKNEAESFFHRVDNKRMHITTTVQAVDREFRFNVLNALKKFTNSSLPQLSGGAHATLTGLSKLVKLHETAIAGKHAVAAAEIHVGDTIATETPLASVLLPEYYGTHCHHCFARLRAPVGCSACSSVAFCQKKCRDKASSTYHKYECKILVLLIGSGMSILSMLALRMVTQVGLEGCLKLHEKIKNSLSIEGTEEKLNLSKSAKRRLRRKKLKECSSSDIVSNDPDSRAYDLVTLSEKRSTKDFFDRTLMAGFLLKCLQKVNFFESSTEHDVLEEEEIRVASILLRNLQLLQFNAHEISETRLGSAHRFRGSRTVYLGVAIYPNVARFNHDCYPAVTRYFVGRKIVLRATRPLRTGEVIAENYGPIFTKRSLAQRCRSLEGRYWFCCTCRACTEDWPDFDNLINYTTRLRCTTPDCEGLLPEPRQIDRSVKCTFCQRKINLKERVVNLRACEDAYDQGLASMEAENPAEALCHIIKALESFHKVAWPPHRETHLAEIALAACMADSGNTWRPTLTS